jgi:hypothetical protein
MKVIRSLTGAHIVFGVLVGSLVISSGRTLSAQADPVLGTWRLNVAKSKYAPGPPPVSETRVYETFGAGGVKATFNREEAGGKKVTITYSAMYDGKDYPYAGSPDADTIALKRVDRNTTEATLKKNGKVTLTTKAVVAPDGKTRTLTSTGTNAQGQKVNNVVVFEKQ